MKRLVLFTSCLLFGCNAILGIEEAHVDSRLNGGADDSPSLSVDDTDEVSEVDARAPESEDATDEAPDDVANGPDASTEFNIAPSADTDSLGGMLGDEDDLGAGGLPSLDESMDGHGGDLGAAGDENTDDTADAEPTLCEKYCEEVMELCTDGIEQYRDMRQCVTVCSFFPEGDIASEDNENTVACRLRYASKARYAAGTEHDAYCRQAGPGGDGRCGSNCESYCTLMAGVCTEDTAEIYHYDTDEACMAACEALPTSDVTYSTASAAVPDGNHVQCRLFHVTSAAMLDAEEHCEHAMGLTLCEASETPEPPPEADAGTSAGG